MERLGYLAEFTIAQLQGAKHLVLADALAPVSFFAYPGVPGYLVPDGCEVHTLATGSDDVAGALEALAEAVGAPTLAATLEVPSRPDRPTGALNAQTVAAAIGALLPEGAVVSDEGNTSGIFVSGATAGAPRHDWLCLTGGAIGQGLPVATGAAVACPGRRVLSLEADGSAMYTLQSLWTQVREGLDVTTVVLNNGSYAILELELSRVGAGDPGPRARGMLDLKHPELDFVALASGMGVPAHPRHHRRGVHDTARAVTLDSRPGPRRGRPPLSGDLVRGSASPGGAPGSIDLNADVGEGAGSDEVLLGLVTSASVACGVHAGDTDTMRRTVQGAARHGVVVGAHPSYPDRAGFGRRPMDIAPARITVEVLAQVAALDHVARQCGPGCASSSPTARSICGWPTTRRVPAPSPPRSERPATSSCSPRRVPRASRWPSRWGWRWRPRPSPIGPIGATGASSPAPSRGLCSTIPPRSFAVPSPSPSTMPCPPSGGSPSAWRLRRSACTATPPAPPRWRPGCGPHSRTPG